jgi:glutamyl endopeptidase
MRFFGVFSTLIFFGAGSSVFAKGKLGSPHFEIAYESSGIESNSKSLFRNRVVVGEDDRILSFDPKVGRLRQVRKGVMFCSAALISKSCALSAGHCSFVAYLLEFDIPDGNGKFTYGTPENTFEVDRARSKFVSTGKENDWAVLKIKPNSITKRLPGDHRGFYSIFKETLNPFLKIALVGYGASNNKNAFLQQRGEGEIVGLSGDSIEGSAFFEHTSDTGNSSSGSPVISTETNSIIGIHTFGDSDRVVNSATSVLGQKQLLDSIQECLSSE